MSENGRAGERRVPSGWFGRARERAAAARTQPGLGSGGHLAVQAIPTPLPAIPLRPGTADGAGALPLSRSPALPLPEAPPLPASPAPRHFAPSIRLRLTLWYSAVLAV